MGWPERFGAMAVYSLGRIDGILARFPHLAEEARRLRAVREEVLRNLDHYVEMAVKAVRELGGRAHVAATAEEAVEYVRGVVGRGKVVVMSKSNTALEVGLRRALEADNEVWETDLGELIVQLANDVPSHMIAPAIHFSKEEVADLFRRKLGATGREPAELAEAAGRFLAGKFARADVGITGANAVAADTGAVVLVENEGNIRKASSLPPIHIAVAGVEKIVPTLQDAITQAILQAAYHGLYPPTYLSVIAGPSSTADIGLVRVSPAQGPREFHLLLVDNGRRAAARDPQLREALLCIRCMRCTFACPIYRAVGREFGVPPYVGPVGVMWTAVTRGVEAAGPSALRCAHAGNCREVCPMQIDIPSVIHAVRARYLAKA